MAINISSSVGEGGKNTPADLVQIDNLLRKAGMLAGGPATPQTRVAAIKKFQEIWGIRTAGKPDGRIDPGGFTLRRLNETVSPLKLKDITLVLLGKGGYGISFTPEAPPKPYELFLGPSVVPGDCLDITGTSSKDIMTAKNLPDLLKIIQKRGAWASKLPIKLFVVLNSVVISESAAQNLDCPVRPHNGKLLPLDTANNGDKLPYQGDSKEGPFYGRLLQKVPGFDGYFFTYRYYGSDSRFETDPKHRGFDCITYAGATCGAAYSSMGGSAADLAAALGPTKCTLEIPVKPAPVVKGVPAPPSPATPATAPKTEKIELEKVKPQYIKDFFAKDKAGYYLLWMGSHIVIVADGTVHEFSHSKAGYKSTSVETWLEPYQNEPLTLRKLPGKPVLAA